MQIFWEDFEGHARLRLVFLVFDTSESETKQRSSTSKGSTLQAGGNVNLIATGGGEDSNILVRGSDIKAGNNLLLAADNNITLEAAQDTFEQHSTSKSKSAAIGVAVTYGADGFAGGTASASASARVARPMVKTLPSATATCRQATPQRSSAATTPP